MSLLSSALENPSGKKVITAEISPPKGIGVKKLTQHALLLKPYVTAINITDCQRALVKMASWAACKVLLDNGVEPVYQLTCRDRNRIALQADLMGAGAIGIPNLLCLTGDPVKAGDHPEAKSVFEFETTGLLQLVNHLQSGTDSKGHKMNAPTKFFVGSVVNPTLKRDPGQYTRMLKKQELGAKFFQTQANYDLDDLVTFLKTTQEKSPSTKILCGILVLHSNDIADYIHNEMPGIQFPDSIRKRFQAARTPEMQVEVGVDIACETMLAIEPYCHGFHLMTIRQEPLIVKVLEKYEQQKRT